MELSQHWKTLSSEMDGYLRKATKFYDTNRAIMAEVHDYLQCGNDASFIKQATKRYNAVRRQSVESLREVWPKVLSSMDKQLNLLHLAEIIPRSFATAASGVTLPSDDGDATFWLSDTGVRKAHARLQEKMDDIPVELAHQVLHMYEKVRLLQVRMEDDGGPLPTADDAKRVTQSFDKFQKLFDTHSKRLNGEATSLLAHVVDASLIEQHAAPAVCKSMAFEKFGHADTASLVTLKKESENSFFISKPLGRLLAYPKPFRLTLSKNMADLPDDFPMAGLLASSYRCTRSAKGWSMQKAADIEDSVTICAGSSCKNGDIQIGSVVASKLDLSNTQLVQMW